jgi:hypothetical protein
MSNHFIEICSECGKVISQCRCPAEDKTKTYKVCNDCKKEIENEVSKE